MGSRLYVGNLSFSTTEDSLRAALEEAGGQVKDIHIVTDRETGRPRGFAFAEMSSDAEAQAVIQAMDGKDLEGRNLTVNEAKPRPTVAAAVVAAAAVAGRSTKDSAGRKHPTGGLNRRGYGTFP